MWQSTIKKEVNFSGVGIHTGKVAWVSLKPSGPNTGLVFYKKFSQEKTVQIPALWKNVVNTHLSTTLGDSNNHKIQTVEHLMAALAGCRVDNLIIEIEGSEVPIMDGSSYPIVKLIKKAGICQQNAKRKYIKVLKEISLSNEDRSVSIKPSDQSTISCKISFPGCAISEQEHSFDMEENSFKSDISKARTFGLYNSISKLHASGMGLGGSLDNSVIVNGNEILNEDGLRYKNEFARHKLLDIVGDLYLAGGQIIGDFKGNQAGHSITQRLVKNLLSDPSSWSFFEKNERSGNSQNAIYPLKEAVSV
ncbi:MAG: UDP-3-O-acyl-N-acetylglucosamine deacetylase [Pseudomonadota bacterium]|nr:UDP-3-O-acyl-N-acetylglucosamine deacetylase [Pseudomonadota bacterium]